MQIKNYIYAVQLTLLIVVLFSSQASTMLARAEHMTEYEIEGEATTVDVEAAVTQADADEVLWLARVLYSESKIAREQAMIAWVTRNRLEQNFRGAETYKDVALSPKQFSGLNPSDEQYQINISRDYSTPGPGWDSALEVAETVYEASDEARPIPETVMHFYSPMSAAVEPDWAVDKSPNLVIEGKRGEQRFAFYDGVK